MRVRKGEIVQQVEFMHISIDNLVSMLESMDRITHYAIILHDKDIDKEGNPVKPHYHIALKFKDSYDHTQICNWLKFPPQCFEKIKGRWGDILKYLIHENAPNKYQYSADDVICNFDYQEEKKDNSQRKEEILNKIVNGEIRDFNLHKEINIIEYDKYKRNIENAFLYRQKILLESSDRKMQVIFITGASGTGKTTYAKMLCDNQNYSYFISSSSNDPFDGYAGQDAIILDDLRGSSFTFADLLKITDNHTSTSVKSRYKNKLLECKLMIITSIMPIEDFYRNVFESSSEPLIQFQRRCQTYIVMEDDFMDVYAFDDVKSFYIKYGRSKNPVAQKIKFENSNSIQAKFDVIKNTLCDIELIDDLDPVDDENIKW